jgi:hypothetical protein
MHHDDIPGFPDMRVGIPRAGFAMGCPSGVTDADIPVDWLLIEQFA